MPMHPAQGLQDHFFILFTQNLASSVTASPFLRLPSSNVRMVFYAYILSVRWPGLLRRTDVPRANAAKPQEPHKEEWRYLVTATSVEVMDQFYRYSRADGMSHLQRKSPELFTYDYAANYPWHYVYNGKEATKLRGKIFFTTMPAWSANVQLMYNNGFVPDHLSGNT